MTTETTTSPIHDSEERQTTERQTTERQTTRPASSAATTFSRIRTSGSLVVFSLITTFLPALQASDFGQQAVNTADAFLRTADQGKEVLSYVHFGADYHGHRYLKTLAVDDGRGSFALVYRFWWEDDGVTDTAFLCDSRGFVYEVRVLATNAVFSQPFFLANASIAVLGHGLIEFYKDKLSEEDRRQLHEIVRKADAKGLLEFSLRLKQVLN